MILSSLMELAKAENLLDNPDYEPKPVAWIILLRSDGELLSVVPTASEANDGKKPRAKVLSIPRRAGRTSAAAADFLVDKSEYVLGVEPLGKRSEAELRERLQLFSTAVKDAQSELSSAALAAVVAFLESDTQRLKAIGQIAGLYVSNDLFAFQVGDLLVHDCQEAKAYYSRLRQGGGGGEVQCLICGSPSAPVEKHPVVKIPGGTTSGVALVSFNSDAFESYGLERNENAPVCRGCADGYTTALNRLLSFNYPDPRHPEQSLPRRFVRLSSDTTAVFWTGKANPSIDLFAILFEDPQPESVEALLRSPHTGNETTTDADRFYCLILTGGQGRATVRGTHTGTVAEAEGNLKRYFASIQIIGADRPLPLRWLLGGLVFDRKLENLPPNLQTGIFTAILFGGDFPRTLLARAVDRCRAEQAVTRERAAILRSYLTRNEGLEVQVALDKASTSAGYRLGRLMAVLERVQGAAQGNPNSTIVDRYYGAASTRPGVVFPRLLGLAQHHLGKLSGGLAWYYQSLLEEVIGGIVTFPATMSLQEQGMFALGYYHQRHDRKPDSQSSEPIDGSEKEVAA